MKVRISQIRAKSLVDGPGQRAVVWFQGCERRCPGCQSEDLWPLDGGANMDTVTVANFLLRCNREAVSFTGGEPFLQPAALADIVDILRLAAPKIDLLVYTGFGWDALMGWTGEAAVWRDMTLRGINTLVDGPYIKALDNDQMQWRGSSNQKPIDVPETLKTGKVVVREWDLPRLVIGTNGDSVAAAGHDFGIEDAKDTRLCGQL